MDCSAEDLLFDEMVGALQEIVMEPEFVALEDGFTRENCGAFEEGEENKNEYMLVFNRYQEQVGKHILQVFDFPMSATACQNA